MVKDDVNDDIALFFVGLTALTINYAGTAIAPGAIEVTLGIAGALRKAIGMHREEEPIRSLKQAISKVEQHWLENTSHLSNPDDGAVHDARIALGQFVRRFPPNQLNVMEAALDYNVLTEIVVESAKDRMPELFASTKPGAEIRVRFLQQVCEAAFRTLLDSPNFINTISPQILRRLLEQNSNHSKDIAEVKTIGEETRENTNQLVELLKEVIEAGRSKTIFEIYRSEGSITESQECSIPTMEQQDVLHRLKALEERLETQNEGLEEIEIQSNELSDFEVNADGEGLQTYESAVRMSRISVPLSIALLENLKFSETSDESKRLITLSGLYMSIRRFEQSEACNTDALRIDPDNLTAKARAAYFKVRDNDISESEILLLEVIETKGKLGENSAIDYSNYATLLNNSKRYPEAIEIADKSLALISGGDNSIKKEVVLATKAAALQNSGHNLVAQKLFFQSYNTLLENDPNTWVLGRVKCEIARHYWVHGDGFSAEFYLHESIAHFERQEATVYLEVEATLILLQEIYLTKGAVAEYHAILDRQLARFKILKSASELVLHEGLRMFGFLYIYFKKTELWYSDSRIAQQLLSESIELYENAGTPNRIKYADLLANVGIANRFAFKDLDMAETFLRIAVATRERHEGKLSFRASTTLKNLAGVLNEKGGTHLYQSGQLYLKALRIRIAVSGNTDFTVAKWLRAFAWLDVHAKRYWAARVKLSYVLQIYTDLDCHPFLDSNVLSVVTELHRVDQIEAGVDDPWDTK